MIPETCVLRSLFFETDFDAHRRVRPSAVLRNFQQVGAEHLRQAGGDPETILRQTGSVYLVSGYDFSVLRQPVPGEIEVRTHIESYPRFFIVRAYEILQNGEPVIRGLGQWFLYRTAFGFPFRQPFDALPVPAVPADPDRPAGMIPPPLLPETLPEAGSVTVLYAQCDVNRHLNNTRYADWCQQITRDAGISHFRIVYKHECRENETILLTAATDDGVAYIRGLHSDQSTAFEAEITIKTE